MPCYHPLAAFRIHGQSKINVYSRKEPKLWNEPGEHLELACGQCTGCRLRRSLEWAMRCMHEAQMHKHNSYITLTYNEENLPHDRSLRHRDYALFMKKLRNHALRAVQPRTHVKNANLLLDDDGKIRFYLGGEYGPTWGRPHYHAILFGANFNDQVVAGTSAAKEKFYESQTLTKFWQKGYATVQPVTFKTAAYISRYIMKKRTGDENKYHYEILDPNTGEIHIRKKEYNAMSRRHAIGKTWWDQYKTDVFTTDKVITKDGRQLKPPRYYDKLLKLHNQAIHEATKTARQIEAAARAHDNTDARLEVKETVALHNSHFHNRNVE